MCEANAILQRTRLAGGSGEALDASVSTAYAEAADWVEGDIGSDIEISSDSDDGSEDDDGDDDVAMGMIVEEDDNPDFL